MMESERRAKLVSLILCFPFSVYALPHGSSLVQRHASPQRLSRFRTGAPKIEAPKTPASPIPILPLIPFIRTYEGDNIETQPLIITPESDTWIAEPDTSRPNTGLTYNIKDQPQFITIASNKDTSSAPTNGPKTNDEASKKAIQESSEELGDESEAIPNPKNMPLMKMSQQEFDIWKQWASKPVEEKRADFERMCHETAWLLNNYELDTMKISFFLDNGKMRISMMQLTSKEQIMEEVRKMTSPLTQLAGPAELIPKEVKDLKAELKVMVKLQTQQLDMDRPLTLREEGSTKEFNIPSPLSTQFEKLLNKHDEFKELIDTRFRGSWEVAVHASVEVFLVSSLLRIQDTFADVLGTWWTELQKEDQRRKKEKC